MKRPSPEAVENAEPEETASNHAETAKVRRYLKALDERDSIRKKWSDPEKRLIEVSAALEERPEPIQRLKLLQMRVELRQAVAAQAEAQEFAKITDEFVDVAASYSKRIGISYAAWRDYGVPPAILNKAGVHR